MERTLHQQLKRHYAEDEDCVEVKVGDFRIDAVRGDELIEIQCASLSAIKSKVRRLLAEYQVRVVKPVIGRKRISKVAAIGKPPNSSRLSPKRGTVLDIYEELIYFTTVFPHPNLVLEVPVIQVEEFRAPPGKRKNRRQRWKKQFQVADVQLQSIEDTHELRSTADLIGLLGWNRPPAKFNTAELASAIDRPRAVAQQIAYVLRNMDAIRQVGRNKSGIVYSFRKKRRSARRPVTLRTAGAKRSQSRGAA